MQRIAYPAVLSPEDGGWFVEFPDLHNCVTEGKTVEDAIEMATDALNGVLALCIERGQNFPDPPTKAPSRKRGQKVVWIHPDASIAIPLRIRLARKQAGLTQNEMAARMGISKTAYQHLEYPKKFNATVGNLERVAKALGMVLSVDFKPLESVHDK